MARKPTGTITEHMGKDGLTYRSLRFSAYGKRRHLALGAITQADAERQLRGVLADVERGVWKEPEPEAPEPEGMPTFHEFAEQWWVLNCDRWTSQKRWTTTSGALSAWAA